MCMHKNWHITKLVLNWAVIIQREGGREGGRENRRRRERRFWEERGKVIGRKRELGIESSEKERPYNLYYIMQATLYSHFQPFI